MAANAGYLESLLEVVQRQPCKIPENVYNICINALGVMVVVYAVACIWACTPYE
jgi:hypothetical protein